MYQFKWSKQDNAMHTISGLARPQDADGFIRQQRSGCPWRIVDTDTGTIVASGIGPDYFYSTRTEQFHVAHYA